MASGFRRFLSRQPAEAPVEDPLEQLAELGREETIPHSTRPKAQPGRSAPAAGYVRHTAREKIGEVCGDFGKTRPSRDDPRNFSAWKRQQSPGIAGLFDRRF